MGGSMPNVPCHLWEPFNHVGHTFRRGDQRALCPGRNRPRMPWVSPKPSRSARRAQVMADWYSTWDAESSPDQWEVMSGGDGVPASKGEA